MNHIKHSKPQKAESKGNTKMGTKNKGNKEKTVTSMVDMNLTPGNHFEHQ